MCDHAVDGSEKGDTTIESWRRAGSEISRLKKEISTENLTMQQHKFYENLYGYKCTKNKKILRLYSYEYLYFMILQRDEHGMRMKNFNLKKLSKWLSAQADILLQQRSVMRKRCTRHLRKEVNKRFGQDFQIIITKINPLRTKRRHRRSGRPVYVRGRQTGPEESSVLRGPGDEVVHPCGPGPRVRVSVSIELIYYSTFRAGPRTTTQLACPSSVIARFTGAVLQRSGVSPLRTRRRPLCEASRVHDREIFSCPVSYLASRTLVGDEHPLVWRVVHRQSRPGRGEIDTGGVHGEATVTNGALSVGPSADQLLAINMRLDQELVHRTSSNASRRSSHCSRQNSGKSESDASRTPSSSRKRASDRRQRDPTPHGGASPAVEASRSETQVPKEQRHAGGDARRDVDTTPKRTENRKNSKKSESVAETSSSPGESDTRRSKKSALSQASSVSDGGKSRASRRSKKMKKNSRSETRHRLHLRTMKNESSPSESSSSGDSSSDSDASRHRRKGRHTTARRKAASKKAKHGASKRGEPRRSDEHIMKRLQNWKISFAGGDRAKAEMFITRLAKCRAGTSVDDQRLIDAVQATLNGEADLWYRAARPSFKSWERFESSFRKMFIGKLGEFKLLQELRNRKQGEEESIVTFIVYFNFYLSHLTEKPSRREQVKIAWNNIRPAYRSALCNRMPRSLKAIQKAGERYEEALAISGNSKRSESETILPLPPLNRHARRTGSRPYQRLTRRTQRRKKYAKPNLREGVRRRRSETRPRKASRRCRTHPSRRQALANSTKQRRIPPAAQHAAIIRTSSARVSPCQEMGPSRQRMPATPLLPLPRDWPSGTSMPQSAVDLMPSLRNTKR
ncbi:unnamed protein product [Trichogramma brassicae]|uniref:Retrotransposon gag domain-containing protein n=1 Tax=Trichogramma brassicae TaxID=86971 RepID=A0A6H5J8K5_9HYME|nr:unnamed protein product [Trichogramma brassicae]